MIVHIHSMSLLFCLARHEYGVVKIKDDIRVILLFAIDFNMSGIEAVSSLIFQTNHSQTKCADIFTIGDFPLIDHFCPGIKSIATKTGVGM